MNNAFKKWDFSRIIRLVVGLGFGIYAVVSTNYLFLFLAAFFLFQAILNISCCSCGSGNCSTDGKTNNRGIYKNQIERYKSHD